MGIEFGSNNPKEEYIPEVTPKYRLILTLNELEMDTLIKALEYSNRSDFTRGDVKLSERLSFLIDYIKTDVKRLLGR